MVCVSTFQYPRRLFSSSIGSWLYWPQPRKSTKLSLFEPPGVYKEPEISQNHQSLLCCCLDNTSPRLAFTSTSIAASGCSIPRPEEPAPVSPCSCPPIGQQLLHSQVNFTSQERACKCTVDFYSQVNSLSRTCLQVHPWLSLASHLAADFIPFGKACHCGMVVLLWRSHPALVSLILPLGATHPAAQDAHCGLVFAFFVAQ